MKTLIKKTFYRILDNVRYRIDLYFLKLKDYERLEHDYCSVLCHATNNTLSRSNYQLSTIYSVIDQKQSEFYYSIVKDDILDIINNDGNIEDIKDYLKNL